MLSQRKRGDILRIPPLFALLVAIFLRTVPAGATPPVGAVTLDRTVAVVGVAIITQSQLHDRARPYVTTLFATTPRPKWAALKAQLLKGLLDFMIDEELQSQRATVLQLTVSSAEIEQAIAESAKLKPTQSLTAETRREFERQILARKLLHREVMPHLPRVSGTATAAEVEEVVAKERQKWLEQLRRKTYVETRL